MFFLCAMVVMFIVLPAHQLWRAFTQGEIQDGGYNWPRNDTWMFWPMVVSYVGCIIFGAWMCLLYWNDRISN